MLFITSIMSSPFSSPSYTAVDMKTGRPPSSPAPPFGRRLAELRRARGLSQQQLAERLATSRKTVDYYERRAGNPSLEVISRVAGALGVSPADIIGDAAPTQTRSRPGPTGRMHQVFEEASRLPRRQQDKIAEFVLAFVAQYEQNRQG